MSAFPTQIRIVDFAFTLFGPRPEPRWAVYLLLPDRNDHGDLLRPLRHRAGIEAGAMEPGARGSAELSGVRSRWSVLDRLARLSCLLWLLAVAGSRACRQPRRAGIAAVPTSPLVLQVYVQDGCPHCAAAKRFVERLQRERPALRVEYRVVDQDPAAARRFTNWRWPTAPAAGRAGLCRRQPAAGHGFRRRGPHRPRHRREAGRDRRGQCHCRCQRCGAQQCRRRRPCRSGCRSGPGRVPPHVWTRRPWHRHRCSPWTTRCSARSAPRAWACPCSRWRWACSTASIPAPCGCCCSCFRCWCGCRTGGAWRSSPAPSCFVSAAVYYAFMAAWLNIFLAVGLTKTVRWALGAVALLIGVFNVKDYRRLGPRAVAGHSRDAPGRAWWRACGARCTRPRCRRRCWPWRRWRWW